VVRVLIKAFTVLDGEWEPSDIIIEAKLATATAAAFEPASGRRGMDSE